MDIPTTQTTRFAFTTDEQYLRDHLLRAQARVSTRFRTGAWTAAGLGVAAAFATVVLIAVRASR